MQMNFEARASDRPSSFWMYSFPATYAAHILEEWFGGFPEHLLRTQGIELSNTKFLVLQLLGLVLMTAGVTLSRKLRFPNVMLTILATVILGNSLAHVARTYLSRGYDPGVLTSVLIWIPLGIYTLLHTRRHMGIGRYLFSATIGVAICVAVDILSRLKV